MERITINKTDLKVYPICLGTANFGDKPCTELSFKILDEYMYHGGNFLDTAAVYGMWLNNKENLSEQIIGRWLKLKKAKNKIIVATKGGHYPINNPNISRITKKDLQYDIQKSLKTLGLDVIDFYWLHRDNPLVPIEKIIDIMEDFKKAGLIRFYGASNFTKERLIKADLYAKKNKITGFSAVSNRWSPAVQNSEYLKTQDKTLVNFDDADLDLFSSTGMSFIPYNATAKGYFEKKHLGLANNQLQFIYQNNHNENIYNNLVNESKKTGKSIQALLLKSMILNYNIQIIPITAASTLEQLSALWEIFE